MEETASAVSDGKENDGHVVFGIWKLQCKAETAFCLEVFLAQFALESVLMVQQFFAAIRGQEMYRAGAVIDEIQKLIHIHDI